MEILPLYKLFTTKEDRLGAYKLLQMGQRPDITGKLVDNLLKESIVMNDYQKTLQYDVDATELEKEIGGSDKAKELAKTSGIDVLTIKQYMFCDLMSQSENANKNDGSYQPFACTTVEEIDELGRSAFGNLWNSAGADSKKIYVLKRNDNDEYKRLLLEENLPELPLTHPYVYLEMYGNYFGEEDVPGFSVCTIMALLVLGREYRGKLDGRMAYLKDYLNNKPDRTVDNVLEQKLEQGFFYNLMNIRALMIETIETKWDEYEYEKLLFAFYGAEKKVMIPGPQVPHFVCKYGGNGDEQLWDAYRTALLDCGDYLNSHAQGPILQGDRAECEFFVNEIWFRYLHKDYANLVTSINFSEKDKYSGWNRLMIVDVDLDNWYVKFKKDAFNKGSYAHKYRIPVFTVSSGEYARCIFDFTDLPATFDKRDNEEVIGYTAWLCRLMWEWDEGESMYAVSDVFVGEQRAMKYAPKVLVTSSCLVSHLRRAGLELYFAFRGDDYTGEPLELYVDNEEDKTFIEECAKSVGASLTNKKNVIKMLERDTVPEFVGLDDSLDFMTKEEVVEEMLRTSLLVLTLDTYSTMMKHYKKDSDETEKALNIALAFTQNEAIDPKTGEIVDEYSDALLYTPDGKTFRRKILDLNRIGFNTSNKVDTVVYNMDAECFGTRWFRDIADDDKGERLLAFPSIEVAINGAKYPYNKHSVVNVPVFVNGIYGRYVRWNEIPKLVPELQEKWEVVDAIPTTTLRKYVTARYEANLVGRV